MRSLVNTVSVFPELVTLIYVGYTWLIYLAAVGYCETEIPAVQQAFTFVGGQALLNCTASDITSHVTWSRPSDGLQVSHDMQVIGSRYRVVGDPRKGQYNLLLRSAQFPADNGTWTCSIFNGPRVQVHVLVMVPPAESEPRVNPISGILFHVNSEAYTFTCSAHYAYPPVSLRWAKHSGPLMEYDPLPPSMNHAPDYTLAASASLILTPRNHGSVFICEASHPTFQGHVYTKEIQFIVADPQYGARAKAQSMPMQAPANHLGPGRLGLIIVAVVTILVATGFIGVMWKFRGHWELDVPRSYTYSRVPTADTHMLPTANGSVHTVIGGDHRRSKDKQRRNYLIQIIIGACLLVIVILSLAFMIPVYLTGFTIPIQGVDEIVTVLAGSLLWLDCSAQSTQTDDLLMVGWRKEYYKFYNQYNNPLLGPNFGFALNSTPDVTARGLRTQNHRLGQIAIWPTTLDDQGLYICETSRILDDLGRTGVQRKLFAVAVLTTPPLNTALMALSGLALIAAVLLGILLIYHTIRNIRKTPLEIEATTDAETKSALTKDDTI